jgi:hypothetical protein
MENNKIPEETGQNKTESIFSEEDFSNQGYDKHIKQARNAIFAVAILITISVLFLAFNNSDYNEYIWLDVLIYGVFVAGFVFLGLWTKKKPYYAIVGALILYAIFIALNAALDITTLYKGIILKIIVVVLLVKGINDAKETQERKEMISK